nr:nitrous oxide reductase maturation protein, outer-membrane lipoprotein [uncultured bacterium]
MNIVDKQHAAQYVTKKGKQFKFDAIECMVNQLREVDEKDIAVIVVSDYGNPGEMTDGVKAIYLVSPKIKSPMGAFLSAFGEKEKAALTQKDFTGELYDWNAIKAKLAKD